MRRDHPTSGVLSFGPFRLHPAARLLERDGQPVKLGARALDILLTLAESAGEVVSNHDLMARVWPRVTVDEGSLRVHVAALRKALGDGPLGAPYVTNIPGRGYCLATPITRAADRQAAAGSAPPSELAATLPVGLGRLVGRDDTIQKITEDLSRYRFISIVGAGGIGKTTVAAAVGHALSADFDGLVSFVDLGPLSEPRLVANVIAAALGPTVGSDDPRASLIAFLQDKRILLVLDSCEHVIDAVAVLAEAMCAAAPALHILATSREPLRVQGEHVHRLMPLRCPQPGQGLRASDLSDFPAAQLFVERVRAASGGFEVSDADAPVVGDICRRLDGIPLALELAAARVEGFGIQGLAARLEDRLMVTTRGRRTAIPRHQTLRATLDWSYGRLPEAEQQLLDRLAIFKGAFTFDAISAVCATDGLPDIDLPEGFADIVAKSLVATQLGTEISYRLLDTTRSYASEKLDRRGERDVIAARHARYVRDLFERAVRQWEEHPSPDWLARYRPQIDNLRAALQWAFSDIGDRALGVALTIAAGPLWSQLSLLDEWLDWVERALSASAALPTRSPRSEMQLNAALGGLQMYAISSVRQSNRAWEATLALATELGETDYQLRALRALWAEAINSGEFRHALSFAERFQDLAFQADDIDDRVVSDRLTGTALHFLGEQDKAHIAIERMLQRYADSAARSQVVRYQFNQAVSARLIRERILWLRGRTESALRDIEENVADALALDHTLSLCNVVTQTACPIALLAGDLDAAHRYVTLLTEHTQPRALDVWNTYAVCFAGALEIERGDPEAGLDRLRGATDKLRDSGFGYGQPALLMWQAGGLLRLDRGVEADRAIWEAIGISGRTGELWCLPELHRLRGEIALHREGSAGLDTALAAFNQALDLARAQQALAWELRAATSLARCLADDARIDDARAVLRQTAAQFTEGRDTPDQIAAAALLR